MKLKIQVVFAEEDDMPRAVEEITLLEKNDSRLEDLGLTLEESKEFLSSLQRRIVERQAAGYAKRHRACTSCGRVCRSKGSKTITFRTLFGNIELKSPRYYTCRCQERKTTKTFSPLTGLLEERTAPELVFMETKSKGFKLEKFAPFVHENNVLEISNELQDAIYHIERNGNSKIILTDLSIKLTRLLHKKSA